MKFLFLVIGLFFINCLQAQQLHLCFKSVDTINSANTTRLSFNVIDKAWANGFVQYEGQKGGVLLSFGVEKIIKKGEGNSSQMEYSFNELVNGKVTGKYVISIAGINVVSFYYYDKKRKVKTDFQQDGSAGISCGCNW